MTEVGKCSIKLGDHFDAASSILLCLGQTKLGHGNGQLAEIRYIVSSSNEGSELRALPQKEFCREVFVHSMADEVFLLVVVVVVAAVVVVEVEAAAAVVAVVVVVAAVAAAVAVV